MRVCDKVEICVRIDLHVWVCCVFLVGYLHMFMTVTVLGVCPGVPVNSRVSTKIQQLLNTLKRPKRPPLSEFFLDDAEEIVEGETRSMHIHSSSGSFYLWGKKKSQRYSQV